MKHSLQLAYLPIPRWKTDKSGWMCFTDKEKEEAEQEEKRRARNQKHNNRHSPEA